MSPRIPSLPPTSRFFARIDRFTCECPRCGQIIQAQFDRAVGKVRREEAAKSHPTSSKGTKLGRRLTYNPLTSRLTCPECRRTFGVGLLLYTVLPKSQPQQPPDTRPTWQELLQLRRLAGGFLVDAEQRGGEPVNVVVEEACSCPDRGTSRHCPVHGWPELRPGYQPPAEDSSQARSHETTTDELEDVENTDLGVKK